MMITAERPTHIQVTRLTNLSRRQVICAIPGNGTRLIVGRSREVAAAGVTGYCAISPLGTRGTGQGFPASPPR